MIDFTPQASYTEDSVQREDFFIEETYGKCKGHYLR